jgi:hypothetical protein
VNWYLDDIDDAKVRVASYRRMTRMFIGFTVAGGLLICAAIALGFVSTLEEVNLGEMPGMLGFVGLIVGFVFGAGLVAYCDICDDPRPVLRRAERAYRDALERGEIL